MTGKDKDREWLLTEKDKFDNEHDMDKNGILDRNEILAWVVPTNEYDAKEDFLLIFTNMYQFWHNCMLIILYISMTSPYFMHNIFKLD